MAILNADDIRAQFQNFTATGTSIQLEHLEIDASTEDRAEVGKHTRNFLAKWHKDEAVIPVLVKKIRRDLLDEDRATRDDIIHMLEGVCKECCILKSLKGWQHIAELYGLAFSEDGVPMLIMEPIQRTLRQLILSQGALPLRTVVTYAKHIAKALQFLHDDEDKEHRVVVHRDLSTINVLVDAQDQCKVTDVGLASCMDELVDITSTARGHPVYLPAAAIGEGTKRYGAPVDIYSLGVIILEMCTGRVPHPQPPAGTQTPDLERLAEDLKKIPDDHKALLPLIRLCLGPSEQRLNAHDIYLSLHNMQESIKDNPEAYKKLEKMERELENQRQQINLYHDRLQGLEGSMDKEQGEGCQLADNLKDMSRRLISVEGELSVYRERKAAVEEKEKWHSVGSLRVDGVIISQCQTTVQDGVLTVAVQYESSETAEKMVTLFAIDTEDAIVRTKSFTTPNFLLPDQSSGAEAVTGTLHSSTDALPGLLVGLQWRYDRTRLFLAYAISHRQGTNAGSLDHVYVVAQEQGEDEVHEMYEYSSTADPAVVGRLNYLDRHFNRMPTDSGLMAFVSHSATNDPFPHKLSAADLFRCNHNEHDDAARFNGSYVMAVLPRQINRVGPPDPVTPLVDLSVLAYNGYHLFCVVGAPMKESIMSLSKSTSLHKLRDQPIKVNLHPATRALSGLAGEEEQKVVFSAGGRDGIGPFAEEVKSVSAISLRKVPIITSLPDLPIACEKPALAVRGTHLYCIGGWRGKHYRTEVYKFEIAEIHQPEPIEPVGDGLGSLGQNLKVRSSP